MGIGEEWPAPKKNGIGFGFLDLLAD